MGTILQGGCFLPGAFFAASARLREIFWWLRRTYAPGTLSLRLSEKNIFLLLLIAAFVLLLATAAIAVVLSILAKRQKKRYQTITQQSVSAIVRAVDAKDPYTSGHSERVALYSAELARRCGLRQQRVADIYYAALLHDIGKIGVPDDILKKPGKLTAAEYDIVKAHTQVGAEIMKNMTAIPGVRRGILEHHERYDGTGYPRGLRGNSISLEGRIIGMADACDAMASTRGYSAAHTKDYIRSEISKGAGGQFDPKMAARMLQMLDEGFLETTREKTGDAAQGSGTEKSKARTALPVQDV